MIQCVREEALQILWFGNFKNIQLMGHTFRICPFLRGGVNCGREAIIVLWCHIIKPSCIKLRACCVDSVHSHEGSVHPKETYAAAQFHVTTFWAEGFRGWFFWKVSKQAMLLNNVWSNERNVPAESEETCWRENWTAVTFGFAYFFFRKLPTCIPILCLQLNIYFASPIKNSRQSLELFPRHTSQYKMIQHDKMKNVGPCLFCQDFMVLWFVSG